MLPLRNGEIPRLNPGRLRRVTLAALSLPGAAQTPPPNPAAAGPGDGRVLSSPSWRVHEPCTLYRSVALTVTGGLDGFREARILLRRVRGGHSRFRVIGHCPARLDMSCARALRVTVW